MEKCLHIVGLRNAQGSSGLLVVNLEGLDAAHHQVAEDDDVLASISIAADPGSLGSLGGSHF
jgi:hypothetical protein